MSHIQDCCFKTYNSCYYAAKNGHLQCLRYAHENGCPWDEWTCSAAAENGQLECLRYAHENGCPVDENTFHEAVKNKRFECLKYLIAHEWKTWKQLNPQFAPRYGKSIQNINILNNSWTVSNYVFLAGMIQSSSHIYKHFYNHSLFDLNLINEILSLL